MGQKVEFETKLSDYTNENLEIIESNPNIKPNSDIQKRQTLKKKGVTLGESSTESKETEVLQLKQKHNKQMQDAQLIEDCIKKNFFMRSLEKQAIVEIIKEMSLAFVSKGTTLFEKGNIGNYFYILKEGELNLYLNKGDQPIKINQGDSFGEIALLHNSPRTGTIIAKTDCLLWVMKGKNFKKIISHINKINFEENKTFIQSIPVLSKIEHCQQGLLCNALIKQSYEKGSYIVKAGEMSTCIYIIKEGEVDVMQNGNLIRTMTKGNNFGERSVLLGTVRTSDIIAKTNCICYSIPISSLKNILGGDNYITMLYLGFIKNTVANSKLFNRFNSYLIEKIFQLFEAKNFTGGTVVFSKGYKKAGNIVVIIDGNLINGENKQLAAERGTILFENELCAGSSDVTDYDLVASPDCLLVTAKTEEVIKKIGGGLVEIMGQSMVCDSLEKVFIFRNLPRKQLELLAKKCIVQSIEDKQKIITEGEKGDKLYFVKSGKVDFYSKGEYKRTLGEKEFFGERALLVDEPRSATAIAKGRVEVFYIKKEDFSTVIESNMLHHLQNRLYLQDSSLTLNDLLFSKHLGSGNYGKVSLVYSKKNDFIYAIKGISRNQINYEQLHENLKLERKILLEIDHQFIVKLVKTLKDERFIYFLMEYVEGKELFDVIRDIGLLNKEQTQFYAGCLILAMEYLHQQRYIYRDIKPENIMVLYKNGYIKIIDFGTAKHIEEPTSTIIGTPHYMAPEIILGGGYSFEIDYWSIAICMYEFVCGGVPFGESAEDPMEVYVSIINSPLTFPSFCKDREFKQLMLHMLERTPVKRLTKANQIKNHVWFEKFNWENLMNMNMKAPYLPNKKDEVEDESPYKGMPFTQYTKNFYSDWVPPEESKDIPKEKLVEPEGWIDDF